jgi:cytoskeletal protein CcmA (bactofilin family)
MSHTVSVQTMNMADLVATYFNGTGARAGAEAIDTFEEGLLGRVLRSPLLRDATSDTQVETRDNIDDLLAFYSLLEIGILSGTLHQELPGDVRIAAERHLSHPCLKRYYEKLYPLLLPRFLLRRLRGDAVGVASANRTDYFVAFLETNEMLRSDEARAFLSLLSDGFVRHKGLEDVLQTLNDPQNFARRILNPPNEQSALDLAVRGMIRFLGFCIAFDGLLQTSSNSLLQSAFWHFHGYWFQQMERQVHGVVSTAIEQYRSWIPANANELDPLEVDALRATHVSMDQAHQSLQRLTSSIYRYSLEDVFFRQQLVSEEENIVAAGSSAEKVAPDRIPYPRSVLQRLKDYVVKDAVTIECFDCNAIQTIKTKADSTICRVCGAHNDLRDYKITSSFSRSIRTHGQIHVTSKGDFTAANGTCRSALIEGKLRGNLTCLATATINYSGKIPGRLKAKNILVDGKSVVTFFRRLQIDRIEIRGRVTADIVAESAVIIRKGGSLDGNVSSRSISVEKGGTFYGQFLLAITSGVSLPQRIGDQTEAENPGRARSTEDIGSIEGEAVATTS